MTELYSCFLHGDHIEEKCPKCKPKEPLTSKPKVMRYECSMAYGAPVMDEDPDYGDWVKFEDFERLTAELAKAKEKMDSWYRTEAQWNARVMQLLRNLAVSRDGHFEFEAHKILRGHRDIERPADETTDPRNFPEFEDRLKR